MPGRQRRRVRQHIRIALLRAEEGYPQGCAGLSWPVARSFVGARQDSWSYDVVVAVGHGTTAPPRASPPYPPLLHVPSALELQLVEPSLPGAVRPRVGDSSLHPAEGNVVVVSTPTMNAQAASLANLAAVVWLGGNHPKANASIILNVVALAAGVDPSLLKVVPFYPEDFLVTFDFCTIKTWRWLAWAGSPSTAPT
ncbi:hypothetical protein ZWY2020_007482 [Hordeum vulgare]|nr:hypothetical protein ZWY2020_007482 [Hordeum vulgare]